jgi:hypothetical protein
MVRIGANLTSASTATSGEFFSFFFSFGSLDILGVYTRLYTPRRVPTLG